MVAAKNPQAKTTTAERSSEHKGYIQYVYIYTVLYKYIVQVYKHVFQASLCLGGASFQTMLEQK